MSQVNEQLITVFSAGSGLSSTASSQISTSSAKVTSISEELTNLSAAMAPEGEADATTALTEIEEALEGVSSNINITYLPALTSYASNLSSLDTHIEERLDLLFEELSVASAISPLSEYSDVDATVNSISGSALGTTDTELLAADNLLDELSLVISNLSLDDITLTQLTEFDLLLSQAIDELNSYSSTLSQTVSDESNALSTLYTRYKQYSKAVSAQLLIADDNVSGFIGQLASSDLESALASE